MVEATFSLSSPRDESSTPLQDLASLLEPFKGWKIPSFVFKFGWLLPAVKGSSRCWLEVGDDGKWWRWKNPN
jgi:hypothetical protein